MANPDYQRQMVMVNKAILYAALLSTGGFALAYFPPDHWPKWFVWEWVWNAILILTLTVAGLTLKEVARLEFAD